jgi:hypothetical protein
MIKFLKDVGVGDMVLGKTGYFRVVKIEPLFLDLLFLYSGEGTTWQGRQFDTIFVLEKQGEGVDE